MSNAFLPPPSIPRSIFLSISVKVIISLSQSKKKNMKPTWLNLIMSHVCVCVFVCKWTVPCRFTGGVLCGRICCVWACTQSGVCVCVFVNVHAWLISKLQAQRGGNKQGSEGNPAGCSYCGRGEQSGGSCLWDPELQELGLLVKERGRWWDENDVTERVGSGGWRGE